jgi:hypothetical protein
MLSIGWQETIVIILIAGGIIVLPAWMIFSKAGYPGALSLLMLIPGVNLVMWLFLGFSRLASPEGIERAASKNRLYSTAIPRWRD